MTKLWQKHWELDKSVESFETGEDLVADAHLVRADVLGSLAHAYGLGHIGILTHDELALVKKGLTHILSLDSEGSFPLLPGDEDVHTKIENFLTRKYGDVGKKIHTGRSRNDQVLTAIRIYTREELHRVWQQLLILIRAFLSFAGEYEFVAMPGYTHMQKAMPSTVGLWAAAFAEGLLDVETGVVHVYSLNNQSPLGSAAAYGVPVHLDRSYTATLLGFAKVQNNSLYCQNGRGIIEASVVASLISVLQLLSKFASDVLLFTTAEFSFFQVSDELCSGSSIMPQKRNIDIAELIRSKPHILLGNYASIVSLSSNLISGYNRDLQDTKKPLIESLQIAGRTIAAAHRLLTGLKPNKTVLRFAMTPDLFAAHRALSMVSEGKNFRDAYREVGATSGYTSGLDADSVDVLLRASTHCGATGRLGLQSVARQLAGKSAVFSRTKNEYEQTIEKLLKNDGSSGKL